LEKATNDRYGPQARLPLLHYHKTPADNCIPQYAIQTSPSVSQKGQVFHQYLTLRFVDNYNYRYSFIY